MILSWFMGEYPMITLNAQKINKFDFQLKLLFLLKVGNLNSNFVLNFRILDIKKILGMKL